MAKKNKGTTGPVLNIMFAFCAMGGAILPFVSGFAVNISSQMAAYYICAVAVVVMLAAYLRSFKTRI